MKDRTWQKILEGLPSVVCVRNAVVGRRLWRYSARISPGRCHAFTSNQIFVAKQDASLKVSSKGTTKISTEVATKAVIQCRSLFTFLGLCENLRRATVESRSNTHPQLWPRHCRHSGRSIPAFEIASQPSKDKCGNTSIFLSGTKTCDTRVDSPVQSLPDVRSRSFPPLVVAERIPPACLACSRRVITGGDRVRGRAIIDLTRPLISATF